jgi:membrane protein implicated in regulation of membrane protease activity
MAPYVYWFLLALVLAGLEMVTGTFYLLVVAIAMAVGGIAALLGVAMAWQLLLGAITGITGTILLRRWKSGQSRETADDNLDIGQAVKVLRWNDDGTSRVSYRGAEWDAVPESGATPREGTLYIAAVRGASLVLTHRKPQ